MKNEDKDSKSAFNHKVGMQKREIEHQMDALFDDLKSGRSPKDKVIMRVGKLQQRLNDLTALVAESYPTKSLDSKE